MDWESTKQARDTLDRLLADTSVHTVCIFGEDSGTVTISKPAYEYGTFGITVECPGRFRCRVFADRIIVDESCNLNCFRELKLVANLHLGMIENIKGYSQTTECL